MKKLSLDSGIKVLTLVGLYFVACFAFRHTAVKKSDKEGYDMEVPCGGSDVYCYSIDMAQWQMIVTQIVVAYLVYKAVMDCTKLVC